MSEQEKRILERLSGIGEMDGRKLDYIEGFVDGMLANRKQETEDEHGKGA